MHRRGQVPAARAGNEPDGWLSVLLMDGWAQAAYPPAAYTFPVQGRADSSRPGREFRRRQLLPASGLTDLRIYPCLRSSNDTAALLAQRCALALPAAVIAARQTAGRGQGENRWLADAGTLTVTFLLPAEPGRPAQQLPLRAGLAVRLMLCRHLPSESLQIKWPNDVLASGRKIAGILCRREAGADLVGVGLNLTTDFSAAAQPLRRRAVSLGELATSVPTRPDAFVQLSRALLALWRDDHWLEQLNLCHALTSRDIAIRDGQEHLRGRCQGIDAQGRLLLQTPAGLRKLSSGVVEQW